MITLSVILTSFVPTYGSNIGVGAENTHHWGKDHWSSVWLVWIQ